MNKLHEINYRGLAANIDNMFPHNLFREVIESSSFPDGEDFLEIGAFEGGTTVLLSELASKLNKKLFVIDSWSGIYAKAYNKYLNNTSNLNNLVTNRIKSNSGDSEEIFRNNKFCYVYIDGDHSYNGCKNDLDLVLKYCNPGTIVCVDDVNMSGVMNAVSDSTGYDQFNIQHPIGFHKQLILLVKK